MKYLFIMPIVMIFMGVALLNVYAWHEGRPVTPYGDFCPLCTQYGVCNSIMSHDDSKKALLEYYYRKGLAVEVEHKGGRFIRAKVKDKDEIVDVIIFDRRTGRIRSIY